MTVHIPVSRRRFFGYGGGFDCDHPLAASPGLI